jgi:sigma-B regulation protein RsbU (phosphoserine phosphatase)
MLENSGYSDEELKFAINYIVSGNSDIYASCVAFEPGVTHDTLFAPYFYKMNNEVHFKNLADSSYNYLNKDWYQNAKQKNQPIWTDPYFDEGGGEILMTTYSLPFYKTLRLQKEFAGVITADISLKWLTGIIDSLKVFESGYVFLITKDGKIITHPHGGIALNETFESLAEKYDRPDLLDLKDKVINGQEIFVPFKTVISNRDSYLLCTDLDKEKWSVCIIIPTEELFSDLHELYRKNLIMGLSGIIILITVILIVSRNIATPLKAVTGYALKIGEGNFNISIDEKVSSKEIGILYDSIHKMQEQLRQYMTNLAETTAAKEKIDSELKIAHDIQLGMIPKIFPPFPHRDDVDLYAILKPARQVGGDLYDFTFFDDNRLCFIVGDVSDKGVPASLMMAITVTLFRAKARLFNEPEKIVKALNEDLCKENNNMMFVTLFLGMIDLQNETFTYCNAGHNYPYMIDHEEALNTIDKTHGPPLGIYLDFEYTATKRSFTGRNKLIAFTDGVVEAMDKKDNLFGEEKLESLIMDFGKESDPKMDVLTILSEVNKFESGIDQSDDITIMQINFGKTHHT